MHEKRYMSHNMRPIFPTRFAGTALTVKLVKQENTTSADLNGMLEAIDKGGPGSVYVMPLKTARTSQEWAVSWAPPWHRAVSQAR